MRTEQEDLSDIKHWAEGNDSSFHGYWTDDGEFDSDFGPWEQIWLRSPLPPKNYRFASVFKLSYGAYDYFLNNFVRHEGGEHNGQMRPSIAGLREAKAGIVVVDIDRKLSLQNALEDQRLLIGRLEESGVPEGAYRCFLSGAKGFSTHLLAEAFGEALFEVQLAKLPLHEQQVLLCLKAVCGGLAFDPVTAQTIRLVRLPNSKHEKTGKFKIPLLNDEIRRMSLEEIQKLAERPRTDVPMVPGADPDEALMGLLRAVINSDEEKAKVEAARQAKEKKARPRRGRPGLESLHVPSEPQEFFSLDLLNSVKERIDALVDDAAMGSVDLYRHWHSLPVKGRDNSESGHDLHAAKELFLTKEIWTFAEVEAAIWLRPKSKAKSIRGEGRARDYVRRTANKALEFAKDCLELRRTGNPVAKARSSMEDYDDVTSTWLYNSNLWKLGKGLGKWGRDIYFQHFNVAVDKAGLKPKEGIWSETYFLSVRTLADKEMGVATPKTVIKHHELLKAIGLLKLVKRGSLSKQASEYKLYVPELSEETSLVLAAQGAKQILKDRKLNKQNIWLARMEAEGAKEVFWRHLEPKIPPD